MVQHEILLTLRSCRPYREVMQRLEGRLLGPGLRYEDHEVETIEYLGPGDPAPLGPLEGAPVTPNGETPRRDLWSGPSGSQGG